MWQRPSMTSSQAQPRGKSRTLKQFSKPGGFKEANKDFDALKPKNVQNRGNDVRTGELPDGTKVIVRPGSSLGASRSGSKPTLEFQPPKGAPTKVRYD